MAAITTTNITTTLVSSTLGISSKDVGTLCSSTAVNKWSRYKPVTSNIYNTLNHPTCGFTIPYTTDSIPKSSLNNTVWSYIKPTGGSTSPYRLGDFRGYDNTVNYTDNKFGITGIIGGINVSTSFGTTTGATLAAPCYMPLFTNAYFGFSIYTGSTFQDLTHKYTKCSSSKIGNNSGELISADGYLAGIPNGSILQIVPFISEYIFTSSTTGTNNSYKKYSLNAVSGNSANYMQFVGGEPSYKYTIGNYTFSPQGAYGVGVNATAYSQSLSSYAESNLCIISKVYNNINGSGTLLFDNTATPQYVTAFTVPGMGSIAVPSISATWGALTSPKSVRLQFMTHFAGSIYWHGEQIYNL